jgi:manganese transport system substrate-binding protein
MSPFPTVRISALGILAVTLLSALSACNASVSIQPPPSGQKRILTSFTVLADIAQNVAGDRAVVSSLTKPGAEVHGYEPTPSDLAKAAQADLILDNGLELERWAAKFYRNIAQVPHVTLSEGVQPIPIGSGLYAQKPNPHAWMSPRNALIYVENVRASLARIDPINADIYQANAQSYSHKIRQLDQQLRKQVGTLPASQRYLVTCEGAFSYLAQDYGLQELYLWPVNADQQGTPQQMRQAIDRVRAANIPAVFCESTVSNKTQIQVAKQTGARFGGVLYVDSLSAAAGPAPTYLKLLAHNINTLITGLQEK